MVGYIEEDEEDDHDDGEKDSTISEREDQVTQNPLSNVRRIFGKAVLLPGTRQTLAADDLVGIGRPLFFFFSLRWYDPAVCRRQIASLSVAPSPNCEGSYDGRGRTHGANILTDRQPKTLRM